MMAERFDALPEEEGRKWELLDGEFARSVQRNTGT
jgi:hypothetical protein